MISNLGKEISGKWIDSHGIWAPLKIIIVSLSNDIEVDELLDDDELDDELLDDPEPVGDTK